MHYETLTDLLQQNRTTSRSIHYLNGENDTSTVPFADLYTRAGQRLGELQRLGATSGDKVILFLNDNEQFIDGFWGAIAGGIVPVPLAVGIADAHRQKLLTIAKLLNNPFLYTDRKNLDRLGAYAATAGELATFEKLKARVLLVDERGAAGAAGTIIQATPDDVAFIQFSSGSTSDPKGVVLTHRNLIANARSVTRAAGFNTNDVSLSWMPLTHDMGLIGMHIFMFANQIETYLMPTELFIRRPLLWLKFASDFGATILSSPNFGYRHFLKVLGDRPLDSWDLSRVRLLFNGAEPISRTLCDEFMTRMTPTKLTPQAMFPVYGLAEASLAVTFPAMNSHYSSISLDRTQLATGQRVLRLADGSQNSLVVMSVGSAIPDTEVRIAADDSGILTDEHVGHVLIRGDNVTKGYYAAAEITARAISSDGWLDTGDMGVIMNGQLYITGRAKEIIFINGQNYYPHDLESVAERATGLELGKVVAAGCRPANAEHDELTFFILHRGTLADFLPIAAEVARLITAEVGLEVAHVVPVKRIPKTTSGKVQRVALEESFIAGEFNDELNQLQQLRHPTAAVTLVTKDTQSQIKSICDNAMPGKNISLDDNLFEIGASSLTLIQIHEEMDQLYPGLIDLTELFDYPTIATLAAHLNDKISKA